MKTDLLQSNISTAQLCLSYIEEQLRDEHARLSALAEISNHRASEKVAVAGLLEQASRAQRELTKMSHTFGWYADYRQTDETEEQ